MTLTQALLAAVAAETACIIFLFGILMTKNKLQDARIDNCESDRTRLNREVLAMQKQMTGIYESLYKAGIQMKGTTQ